MISNAVTVMKIATGEIEELTEDGKNAAAVGTVSVCVTASLLARLTTFSTFERIAACFAGIAVGDAVGKQTEMLAHDQVSRFYPLGVRGFEGTPGTIIPRYAGNSKREWRIGETTDDTERTLAVANAIIADRLVSHVRHWPGDAAVREMRAPWCEVSLGVPRSWRSCTHDNRS